ncbi:hypothetical protein I547_6442 [Mycobacterium kansasii 824]|uniref:Uncharacterized protein n=1 Tax=Mycobacterium kansasii TaxID=1768 RepID=A0A1V3X5E0_MYCKA|nr:hypothetical protein I547_6442 [Mycobacterium kansasii 824]OOK73701.1 hypothetical protein BZL30_5153 [Mycobacterium kansasii]
MARLVYAGLIKQRHAARLFMVRAVAVHVKAHLPGPTGSASGP